MDRQTTRISPADIDRQREFCEQIHERSAALPTPPMAMVHTYGCQQNAADGERMKGMLSQMGFSFTDSPDEADLVLFNTCAVREHAEDRVFGNVGALKNQKRRHPGMIIALCGCMMEQEHVAERIKKSFPYVNLVFGTHVIHRLPFLLLQTLTDSKRVFERGDETPDKQIPEGLPVRRDSDSRAFVTVMYGCNNFCSYCIVPYVRGRERSREPDAVVEECRGLAENGYKEITLLGQNVNSYGKTLANPISFAELLRRIDAIDGDYRLRFMTSHPKDATKELIDTMAQGRHIAHHLHLPFQSGNDRILKEMNRHYDRAGYLDKVRRLREQVPDVVITSDVIVGFPGETTPEFEETLSLIEEVRFDALFTFIYSPREGTPAASMPDPMSRAEKQANFQRLVDVQNVISAEKHAAYVGKTLRCLIDGVSEDAGSALTARTPGNRLVRVADGDASLVGQFRDVEITAANTWSLFGKLAGRG